MLYLTIKASAGLLLGSFVCVGVGGWVTVAHSKYEEFKCLC